MPLISNKIQTNLISLLDKDSSSFVGFKGGVPETAESWADAVEDYAKDVLPKSTTAAAARAAFITTFLGMNNGGNGLIILPAAFMAYATALAVGMAPTFTSVPPPVLLSFVPIFAIGMNGGSGRDVALAMAAIIDTWFRTGTAINNLSSVVINWN